MLKLPPVHNKRRHRNAFSFVELIVVLVIIGVMSAVAVPRLSGSMANRQLDSAKRRVELDLAQTQQRARVTGTQQKIDFNISNSRYSIAGMADPDQTGNSYTVELDQEPYNATITAVNFGSSASLTYDGYGQPQDPGYVTLQVGEKSVTITVGNIIPVDIPIDPGTLPLPMQ